MTSLTVPTIDQVAPGLVTRVREGDLGKATNIALGLGAIGMVATLIAMVVGWSADDHHLLEQALFSYLVGYMFTLGITLGSLFLVMVLHITRAGWGTVVRRIAENVAAVLPWMAVLFLPIAIGYHTLFHHWVEADPGDIVLAEKSGYLDDTFFMVRAVLYFVAWTVLARFFRGNSLLQDQDGDPGRTLRMARRAAPGLLVFALSITFAAIDWIMSLDPHWFSTIFGVTYFAGAAMATLAIMALLPMWLSKRGYLGDVINTEHYHDIGKLMFAFMVFWTYTNFSQYMLIWYANLPEETLWYQHRAETHFTDGVLLPWGYVGTILVLGHFIVPFGFLMSRHIKRNRATLAFGAVFLLVMHWVDMQYLIMPTLHHHGLHPSWLDFTAMLGILGIVFGLAIRNIRRTPLIPIRDPRLEESLKFHNI